MALQQFWKLRLSVFAFNLFKLNKDKLYSRGAAIKIAIDAEINIHPHHPRKLL